VNTTAKIECRPFDTEHEFRIGKTAELAAATFGIRAQYGKTNADAASGVTKTQGGIRANMKETSNQKKYRQKTDNVQKIVHPKHIFGSKI
jgi:hypothetical protein